MKKFNNGLTHATLILCCLALAVTTAFADDTCVFMVTADNVEPNIVVLLDNGAEMQHAVWHTAYDDSADYTPNVSPKTDVVPNGASGNGFFNDAGYGIDSQGGQYYLVKVLDNLEVGSYGDGIEADSSDAGAGTGTWTINGKTVTLPVVASSTADAAGVIDKAGTFRYAKNYLNWMFFSGSYTGNGSDLPHKSRFYYAKTAIMTVAKLAANQAKFSIYNFTDSADGASNVQPLGMVVNTPLAALPEDNTLESNFINNINNMGTVTYSPLAEGLARVGGYYGSPSSSVVGYYCQNNFVIVVSPGISSEDQAAAAQSSPASLSDYDGDGSGDGNIGEGNIMVDSTKYSIPVNYNGTTYLDDVAYYLWANDIVDYQDGFQNVMTYTIGFMGDQLGNLFLKNTSNNGNGNVNLYDTSHEEYGKYHYEAEDPDMLASALLAAVNDILSATSSFTAPVVPVTRTTSGNRIYMAFFTPEEDNFWEGNVTKFGISDSNEIIDVSGNSATWPNGAIREDAQPYWQTKDWADPEKATYVHNADRNIYTYVGYTEDLTASPNAFIAGNPILAAPILGNPSHTTAEIINFVRGADVTDEDGDGDSTENRSIITGDVLHSEPLVLQYTYADDTSKTMVYFGANDGMLHAVLDVTDPDISTDDDETTHGTEAWAFIPPDQLHRLKDMLEGLSHTYYVDSSPKAYFHDVDEDGRVDVADGDKVVLVCGARKGGTGYFALDVTDPLVPEFLWRIDRSGSEIGILALNPTSIVINNGGTFQDNDALRILDGDEDWGPDIAARVDGGMSGYFLSYDSGAIPFGVGGKVGNLTTAVYQDYLDGGTATPFILGAIAALLTIDPDVTIAELGESWSEPQFGLVKTDDGDTTGTPVFFIGGGYSSDHSAGNAVIAINALTGEVVKIFENDLTVSGMDYSIASSVAVIDADNNGFVDKVYVGDLGGQVWRLGKFTDAAGSGLDFPECDENIMNWTAQLVFVSDPAHERTFYYPPGITLEKGYDLVFAGTGNREDPCQTTGADRIYSFKDTHEATTFYEADLVNVTDPAAARPDLDNATGDVDANGKIDQGWYIQLGNGEKVLAENTIFYKTLYFTTFTPNDDVCMPGGVGKIYGVEYKAGQAVLDFDDDAIIERGISIGGGIPSKVVTVLTDVGGVKSLISVGSTNPDSSSESFDAGVVSIDPLAPNKNFFHLWWRELLNI